MSIKNNYLKKYYGKTGNYLKEHESFLNSADVEKDVVFLIKALELKKDDMILDIACGQGRHTTALCQNGYSVDGVDFSTHLLDKAKKSAKILKSIKPKYFISDIINLKLKKKYNKIYWFFSDLANIDLVKAINSICGCMQNNGIILVDVD